MSRSFDATDDVINHGLISNLIDQSQISFVCWVRFNNTTADNGVIDVIPASATNGWAFWRDDTAFVSGRTDCFTFYINDAGVTNRVETATNSGSSGVWHAIGCTFRTTTTLRVFINFAEDANSGVSSTVPGCGGDSQNTKVGKGGLAKVGDCQIAHMQVWNRELSEGEIYQALRFPGSITQNLQIFSPYWGTTSPEPDYSGNGNNGTVTGAIKGTTDPPINGLYYPSRPQMAGIF